MKKEKKVVICGPRRELFPEEKAAGWVAKAVNCDMCNAELMFRPDPEIGDEAIFRCFDCGRASISHATEFRMTKQNKEAVRQRGADPEELAKKVEALLGFKPKQKKKLAVRLLQAWWELQMWVAKIWWREHFMVLASVSDTDFLDGLDRWRSHPSHFVRVCCSRRWVRITWPNDPVEAHEEDARLMWERQKEK